MSITRSHGAMLRTSRRQLVSRFRWVLSYENALTWLHLYDNFLFKFFQFHGAVWIITYNTTRYFFIAWILRILYHWIPAYALDRILVLRGQKPKLLKIYRKVTYFSEVLNFFLFNEWHFETTNLYEMIEAWVKSGEKSLKMCSDLFLNFLKIRMSESDRKEFFTDPKDINWNDYMGESFNEKFMSTQFFLIPFFSFLFSFCAVKFCYGLRKFVAKQSEDTIPLGRKVYRQRKIIHNILMTIIYTLMALFFYRVLKFYGFNDFVARKIDEYRLPDFYLYIEWDTHSLICFRAETAIFHPS